MSRSCSWPLSARVFWAGQLGRTLKPASRAHSFPSPARSGTACRLQSGTDEGCRRWPGPTIRKRWSQAEAGCKCLLHCGPFQRQRQPAPPWPRVPFSMARAGPAYRACVAWCQGPPPTTEQIDAAASSRAASLLSSTCCWSGKQTLQACGGTPP